MEKGLTRRAKNWREFKVRLIDSVIVIYMLPINSARKYIVEKYGIHNWKNKVSEYIINSEEISLMCP